jgi:hypothetical protein
VKTKKRTLKEFGKKKQKSIKIIRLEHHYIAFFCASFLLPFSMKGAEKGSEE